MSLRKMQREYRETPKQEIRGAILENAVYGFLGSIIVVFIANRIDIAVLIGYMTYYFYVGKVINRPKYVTSLGKFIIFPVPTALGAFTGYKIAEYISTLIIN
jgi:predicted tellurium resistance membrane protein TerC